MSDIMVYEYDYDDPDDTDGDDDGIVDAVKAMFLEYDIYDKNDLRLHMSAGGFRLFCKMDYWSAVLFATCAINGVRVVLEESKDELNLRRDGYRYRLFNEHRQLALIQPQGDDE